MKKQKIFYWILTGFFLLSMSFSGIIYLTHQSFIVNGFQNLGYPIYLLNIIGTGKIIGVLAILQNRYKQLKEWAYAGFTINLLGAAWSHIAVGESPIAPIIMMLILAGSYLTWKILIKDIQTTSSKVQPFVLE
jgi:DoxX-like protein